MTPCYSVVSRSSCFLKWQLFSEPLDGQQMLVMKRRFAPRTFEATLMRYIKGLEIWKSHFAPHADVPEDQVAMIPVSWFNFIINLLMSPDQFEWAVKLLQTPLWALITENNGTEEVMQFHIPNKCPASQSLVCKSAEKDSNMDNKENELGSKEEIVKDSAKVEVAGAKKRRGKTPIVESEVSETELVEKLAKKPKRKAEDEVAKVSKAKNKKQPHSSK